MQTLIALVLVFICLSCIRRDVERMSQPDKCDPRGECNVGKRPTP
jgi:hypothetical protein